MTPTDPIPPATSLVADLCRGFTGDRVAWLRARHRVHGIVEVGHGVEKASQRFDTLIVILIIANIAAFMLETVRDVRAQWGDWLQWFEVFSVLVFTAEFIVRLWTAVEVPFLSKLGPFGARWEALKRPAMLIDLLAILPTWIEWIGGAFGLDLRVLRVLRLLRFFKLSRYSPAMHTVVRVLANERRSLIGAGLLLIAVLIVSSTVMYYLENERQPEKFSSVPAATYWAMTTLTTVGYGDLVPETPLGKIWAMVTMVVGLCTLALPVAIISTGFAQEVGRRDFVVTWSMMSRIPLFAELSATEVAAVMPLLHTMTLPPQSEVIHAGTPGDAMYFVASGRVRQTLNGDTAVYRQGDFFGSAAMIKHDVNGSSFSTLARCRLLKLHRSDFARLEQICPSLYGHVRSVPEDRPRHAPGSTSSGGHAREPGAP